jgi:hypothetical protein
MSRLLERLGGFAARRFWVFIVGWLIILGGLLGARHAFAGEYVKYTVPGSGSSNGLNLLNMQFPRQPHGGGPAGLSDLQRGRGLSVVGLQVTVRVLGNGPRALAEPFRAGRPARLCLSGRGGPGGGRSWING